MSATDSCIVILVECGDASLLLAAQAGETGAREAG